MQLQNEIVSTGKDVFGVENMTNQSERLLRFGEESMELMRTGGLSRDQIVTLMDYEFSRNAEPMIEKEMAGCGVTLFALADAHGFNLIELIKTEIKRVRDKKLICQAKHAAKPASVRAA